ncbi:MAG: WD40/YVTN/BNR-like repeat-containing protein [Chloroflexota bacterium]
MERIDGVLLVATKDGLVVATSATDGWRQECRFLTGHDVTSVVSREGVILAGTTEGVFRSNDVGTTWSEASEGLSVRHIRWLAYHPDISDLEFAGTEPAGIFVSHDGAGTWRRCPEVAALRDRHGWFLPYSPEAGCVRSLAFHGDRVYAGVEVGGVLRSDDSGETWRLAGGSTGEPVFDIPPAPQVFSDVHWVATHPDSPNLVFAATAEGLYLSTDGGDGWTATHAGSYCRAVWVDPGDRDHIVLAPADTVSRKNGGIEESHDAGQSWTRASDGLDLPWPDRMVERFAQIGDQLFAVTNDGRLYAAPLGTMGWQRVLPDVENVKAVAEYRRA